jgi:hypothetical protein
MIIKLSGADFSYNNIGQTTSYLAKTLAVIDAFGADGLTSDQKIALNTFISFMQDNSLFDKCKHFYMPVLASDVDDAFINVADDSLTVEISPVSGELELSNKGVVNTGNSTTSQVEVPTSGDGLSPDSFHLLSYITYIDDSVTYGLPNIINATTDWYTNVAISGSGNWGLMSGSNLRMNGSNVSLATSESGSSTQIPLGFDANMYGFTVNQEDFNGGYYLNKTGAVTRFYTVSGVRFTDGDLDENIKLTSYNNAHMKLPQGIISVGSGLTSTEMENLNSAVHTLMSALEVSNI